MAEYKKLTKAQVNARIKKNGIWEGVMVPNKCAVESQFSVKAKFEGVNGASDFEKQLNSMSFYMHGELGSGVALYEEVK